MTEKERLAEHLEDLIKLKEQGLYYKEIAQMYNSSTSTVRRLLSENGIIIRNKITDDDIKKIIRLYDVENFSMNKIGKIFHLSDKTVAEILKNNNIHIKTISEAKQNYTINEEYFDVIDNKDKAYWLGWLWSDGHNQVGHNQIIIQIQESDGYILELLNKDIDSNRPIKFVDRSKDTDYKRKNQNRYVITNKHMSESLLKLGMVHDKGLKATFPEIPKELYSHFIRGYFDGDGWISKNPKDCRINFTGTIWLCESIQKILKEELDVNSYMTIPHNKIDKPTRTLIVAGNNQVKKVLDYIYNDSDYHYLIRKYDIYQNIYA